jgi:high-affinity iron transporter
LHTLVGYADQPSILQVVVYFATLCAIVAMSRMFAPAVRPSSRAAKASAV